MAKTKTSSEVKQRYNKKVYTQVGYWLPKDLVAKFKEKCERYGISQASVVREAIEKFLKEE